MNDQTVKAIVEEIAPLLAGRVMGRVFQLSRTSLAVDFRLHGSRYLFVSVDPSSPRLYLVERRVRELEKQSLQPSPFVLALRKHLSGAELVELTKDEGDRIARFSFNAPDQLGNTQSRTLVAQLTGRAANLLLLDERGVIIDTLRQFQGEGQEAGELYKPPAQAAARLSKTAFERGEFASLSEAADDYYTRLEHERSFDARAATLRARINKELAQRVKLRRHLAEDMIAHGDADEHKRIGDLLLANIATARRQGTTVTVTDYFKTDAPLIELEVDEQSTLQQEAARRFALYTKARRASREISERLEALAKEVERLEARKSALEEIIAERDFQALEAFAGGDAPKQGDAKTRARKKETESVPGARTFRSSEGYEILVGRAARDNDHLTFRVARPHDLWLHAADYPGSHVIVRNPTRTDVPHRTIIEAAQLAANFSAARNDTKVAVNYTQRKFLSKPRGAAPGLVRISSFRTITVEPRKPEKSEQ